MISPEADPRPDEPAGGGSLQPRILVLDDDPFALDLISEMLRSVGYTSVATSARAQATLVSLHRDPQAAEVILCDINMPGMDGIEFLQRLNASAWEGTVILLSGEGARVMQSVLELLAGGRLTILGLLEKPVARQALQALLGRWQPYRAPAPAAERLHIDAAELHAANRHRQWVLHYQPIVKLRTGELERWEALIRWNHPRHGLLYPDRFIGLAEDCGAVDAMTEWVLQGAMQQLVHWRAQGLEGRVAVNVSMENLRSPHFVRRIVALARETGASPRDVTLEVGETHLITHSTAPLESLVRLRMQRFGLAIDDFGSGPSSLSRLCNVPFTELKIDRRFVAGARGNTIILPILEGSVGIARRLGMGTVAVGVESMDDWELLREIGCDCAQGWFVGRPMPAERIEAWISDWESRRPGLV
jgi:EAL domain-containing protein (putative c-di-GMP-specific phosphodiesterase class I)